MGGAPGRCLRRLKIASLDSRFWAQGPDKASCHTKERDYKDPLQQRCEPGSLEPGNPWHVHDKRVGSVPFHVDYFAQLADLGVCRVRYIWAQVRGGKVSCCAAERLERQGPQVERASEPKKHQPEISGAIDVNGKPNPDELTGRLEDQCSLLAEPAPAVVAQLDLRRRVCFDLGNYCELGGPPVDSCNEREGTQNCEQGNDGAAQFGPHSSVKADRAMSRSSRVGKPHSGPARARQVAGAHPGR